MTDKTPRPAAPARTRRRLAVNELFALTAAATFWKDYVEEHHEHADGGGCVLDLDLDELETELDVWIKKSLRRARKLGGPRDNPLAQLAAAFGAQVERAGSEYSDLAAMARDEETWAMCRAYVLAWARGALNAR